ncbi:AI-2E family transporter [Flavobacterium franklandianum]|uniref:AI-2E family transporter n=1 Tax=Flavobacterium franklandianum TaxID=2594430 RepID=A0A553CKJ8_9FLAO|nr:AI-2E family transporter [Flavobacterium franklandianum]TRX20984.1 AI-2E family transporter [Flavobacterium franklandianum]
MTATITSVIKKLLLLFLVFAGLYYAKAFLMPLCIGGILATLFLPFCNWMEKRKTPKGLAVFICLLTLILGMCSIFSLLGWKIYDLLDDFAMMKKVAIDAFSTFQRYIYNHLNLTYKEQFQILRNEQPSYGSLMQMVLASLANFVTNLILVLVYFLFLLYYRGHIKIFFVKYTESSQQDNMEHLIDSAANISHQYLLGISKMIVLLWILYGIGFSLLGVENALFFAILCGILEIVPYIGNITGTALTLVVAALHGADLSMLGGIVVVYGTIQMFQGWVLEPFILGPQVKINPLFTIFALVLGELIWGISGMLLAIPMIAIFKIICDHIDSLKPYGFLIGGVKERKKELGFIKKIKVNT